MFRLRNIKIKYRLFTAFFSLVLLVIVVISILQFFFYIKETKTKIGSYSIANLTQIAIALDNTLSRMDDYYLEIASSGAAQAALAVHPPADSIDYLNNQYRFRETIVQKYSFFKYIKNIYILDADFNLALSYTNIYGSSNLSREDIAKIAESDKDGFGERCWLAVSSIKKNGMQRTNNKDSLILHSLIRPNWNQGLAGYMVAEIKPDFLLDVFSEPKSGDGIETFLLDLEGVVFASVPSESLAVGKKHDDREIMQKINGEKNYVSYKSKTQSGMMAYVPVSHSGFYAVSVIPDEYFISASQGMKSLTFIAMVIFLLLSVLITIVITKSIHDPLKQLSLEMDKVKSGNFSLIPDDPYQDEVSELRINFFYMAREVKRLTQDIRSHARQTKIAEIAALQAQINPHFLSNTLGSIQWMASVQGAWNIEEITKNLIGLLHMCAQKGRSFISIREELEYLNCYVNVQKYRYLDKFEVSICADESVLDTKVPQFILQPIIENSIIHGIEPIPGQGRILVCCEMTKERRLRIAIEDNGIGLTKEQMMEINENHGEKQNNFNSIGLNNIKERLLLYYAKDFQFWIDSKEGSYTKVILELPLQRAGDEYATEQAMRQEMHASPNRQRGKR